MHKAVKENEDVLFFWTSACATIDQELKNLLLDKIIQGYVALRGHAYAAQWMEEYKRKTKKSVAKTRSFRSRLHDYNDIHLKCIHKLFMHNHIPRLQQGLHALTR